MNIFYGFLFLSFLCTQGYGVVETARIQPFKTGYFVAIVFAGAGSALSFCGLLMMATGKPEEAEILLLVTLGLYVCFTTTVLITDRKITKH